MQVISIKPKWGENYRRGYIGFTYKDDDYVSIGISYFTRWSRREIPVSHALVVTDRQTCIEAHLGTGVREASLWSYFNNPQCRIFFRKPRFWSHGLGNRIVDTAASQIGCRYATPLIVAHMLANTAGGRLVNRIFGHRPDRWLSRRLDCRGRMICSQLAAYSLAQQPEFAGLGCLAHPLATIDPQELFEDDALFEPWKTNGG